jgi:MinD-like ATPase involved in chromosome partitioning or flagellar assembly
MNEIEVALAISARDWPDRIHRFLADHGGARVRAQVLSPEDAIAERYQILVIDDICSFLTPRLVDEVRRRQKMVLGVFDPTDAADGKARLLECGVDLVIESDAEADEFVVCLRSLAVTGPGEAPPPDPDATPVRGRRPTAVSSPAGGTGATELAVAWAHRLSRHASTVLVDCDDTSPAIAQRLGLPLLPNIRSAIDTLQQKTGGLERALAPVGRMAVLAGLSGERDWMEVRPAEIADVLQALTRSFEHVVVNPGSRLEQVGFGDSGRYGISRQVIATSGRVVAVGDPSPVGVTRMLGWLAEVDSLNPEAPRLVVMNRQPSSRFRRAEIADEITRAVPRARVAFLPTDPQVEAAAWSGKPVTSGPYQRAVRKLVASFEGVA